MECLDQVNFNLVPADRASTAALDIAGRCPACDNYRSGGSPNNTDNNSNCPASRNLISTQSTRFSHCSCPPTTTTTNPNNRTSHNIDCHCNMSPSSPSSSPSLIRPISTSSPKSPTPSSSSPRSTTSSTPTTSHLDHQRICLSCNQSQNQAFNTHSHPFRIPHSSSTTDSLHSLEGSSPPIMTTATSHNTDTAHHSQSSSYDQREFQLNAQVHSPTSTLSAFHRDVNANSDNATTILLPSSSSQSPPYHNHNHQQRNQSKPIPIQNKSPTSRGARPRHHNDTDLTEGCSLTPSAYADRRWGSMNADCQSSRYNPFASSPAERLSLHFYSQQSPKYFRQPSSSSTPTQPGCHSHGQGQGHTTQEPTTPTVFDQWPIGLSTNVKNNNKKTTRSPDDNETKRLTKSLPRKTGNLGQKEADRHCRPHSSWKARWNSSGGNGDVSSDEDDVMMTPVDGAADPAVANVKPSERALPQELLFQLHDLEHQNEDLSADVIFSLERKGFVIHEVLGKGISSTVRRVTEKNTGQEYAVKIIDISGEKGDSDVVEQTRKDTLREIQILRMCGSHDNIIHLHDVFETPTFIFLVFELCRQGELFDYLTSVVSLSEKRTRTIMRQLLEAVQYIHEYRVVHRDLKPENILLDDDLNIKVSDFGFATIVDKDEELGELCGTPGYLAPEVLAHSMYENVSGYGKEVDMWACGVIMYTLLCGAPPFWNRRQMMMLRAIMNADYTFNSPEWDDISEAPKKLIKKLLVVNPKERLTAREALAHPFFQSKLQQKPTFKARRKFRAAVFCVLFYKRLSRFYKHPPPISMDTLCTNPYSIKLIRKAIDTCAFSMYRHWVKRVDNQNRAALFEHALRDEWKHNTVVVANNTKETPQTQRH